MILINKIMSIRQFIRIKQKPYFIPREYSINEIQEILFEYKNQKEKYYCPLTKKTYKTYGIWVSVFASRMKKECVNKLIFLMQEPHYSKFSGLQLSEEEFSYSEPYKGWVGFKKYTLEEIKNRVWLKIRDYSFKNNECSDKISLSLKKFYSSEEGKTTSKTKSEKMIAFFKTEKGKMQINSSRKKNSINMKKLIMEGKFTPCINNTWTHWDSKIELENGVIKKFRSSWEACFFYSNRHLIYENIRIKHNNRTYINDFYDQKTKTLYEIKPRSRYNIEIEKMHAFQEFCKKTNIKFVWINEYNILDYIDIEKIKHDTKNANQFEKMISEQTIKKLYEARYSKN